MKRIIITKLPIAGFSYFQWLLLGFYELENQGIISLSFDIPLLNKFALLWTNNKWIAGCARRLVNILSPVSDFLLRGKIEENGKVKYFAVDPKDSPYIYDVSSLEQVDAYFKLQCPKIIGPEGFHLTKNVILPWFDLSFEESEYNGIRFSRKISDKVYLLRNKIKPGMIGPRRLAWSCKYKEMKKQYEVYLESQNIKREGKLCAYFRNAEGPIPSKNLKSVDPDLEWDLMAAFPQMNHPNLKRGEAVRYMKTQNSSEIDGRIIFEKDFNTGNIIHHSEDEVPLNGFCDWIAKYNYNLNISGFRLSIPNRFIESFIAGTGIVTDRLSVKWYLPFEEEVIETVSMGYEPQKEVDWSQFKKDIASLPESSKERIISLYEKKWSPTAFAKYLINETLNK